MDHSSATFSQIRQMRSNTTKLDAMCNM